MTKQLDPSNVACARTPGGGWGNEVRSFLRSFVSAQKSGQVPWVNFDYCSHDQVLSNWFQGMATTPEMPCPERTKGHCLDLVDDPLPVPGGRRLKVRGNSEISCAMRQYMDHPTDELMARLSFSMSDLAPRDVLISMHLRFGDGALFPLMSNGSTAGIGSPLDDSAEGSGGRRLGKKISQRSLDGHQVQVDRMIGALESREPSLRVRLFVTSDIPKGVEWASKKWKDRVLPLKQKVPFHSTHQDEWRGSAISRNQHRTLIADMVSDWYLLAVADIVMRPMESSFSETAEHLGIHGPCHFFTNKGITDGMVGECVEQVLSSLKG